MINVKIELKLLDIQLWDLQVSPMKVRGDKWDYTVREMATFWNYATSTNREFAWVWNPYHMAICAYLCFWSVEIYCRLVTIFGLQRQRGFGPSFQRGTISEEGLKRFERFGVGFENNGQRDLCDVGFVLLCAMKCFCSWNALWGRTSYSVFPVLAALNSVFSKLPVAFSVCKLQCGESRKRRVALSSLSVNCSYLYVRAIDNYIWLCERRKKERRKKERNENTWKK